jgi:hypothetical protein
MSVEECVSPEELAQLFHRYHGVLTGCFDGRTATAPWEQVDPHQRRLLIATARLVLSDLAAKQQAGESEEAQGAEVHPPAPKDSAVPSTNSSNGSHADPANRRYYAKPGQAEWGC